MARVQGGNGYETGIHLDEEKYARAHCTFTAEARKYVKVRAGNSGTG